MNRRAFLAGAGAGLIAPSGRAQQAGRAYRIGILSTARTSDPIGALSRPSAITAFLRGMRDLGYVNGEHFVIEHRGHEGKRELYAPLAAELVGLNVDVIVSSGHALAQLKQATQTIPIVMAASADPVGEGLVRSLNHPGGNFTGLSHQSVETTEKRLELLKELVPGAASVAVIWNLEDKSSNQSRQLAEATARARGWKMLAIEIRDSGEIEAAFKAAIDARAGSLLMNAGGLLFSQRQKVADQAAKSRLPTMYAHRQYVEAGGLIAYSTDVYDIWRRAAVFVVKVMKGAKPSDLPIQQPTKFDLVINLKTAKALGLTVPQSLLLRVDEVIE